MEALGTSVPVHDGRAKVTGSAVYTDDLQLPGMLYGKLIFSPHPHAEVLSIDTMETMAMEGVRGVYTAFNTTGTFYNGAKRFDEQEIPEDEQIFPRILKHTGDRLALVVGETPEAARQGAKKLKVSYRVLEAHLDPEEAADHPDYRLPEVSVRAGNPEEGFKRSDFIFEDIKEVPPIHHLALEPHSVVAQWEPSGKATVWTSTQTTFAVRLILSEIFDLPRSNIRVIKPVMGGGFGAKIPMILEPVALAAARALGCPVKITLTRQETFFATRTRHGARIRVKTGVNRDGEIIAQKIDMLLNAGAYCTQSINVAAAAVHDVVNCYRTEHIEATGRAVRTNLPVAGAMRGYGSPQIYFALQTHLDRVARSLGIGFPRFQRINMVRPQDTDPLYRQPLGNPRPLDCLERGLQLFQWDEKAGKPKTLPDGRLYGIGLAAGTHANGVFGAHLDYTGIRLKMNDDNSVILFTGSHDMGNGSVTVQKMIVSQELQIPLSRIYAVESDTENCPFNLGDYASRGVFVSAEAVRRASVALKEELLKEAGRFYSIDPEELEISESHILRIKGKKSVVSRIGLLRRIHQEGQKELEVTRAWANAAGRTSYGVHFAEVAVNRTTGEIEVLSYCAVHDVGKVLNRQGIEGQLEGGIHMSLGYALSEELIYSEKGMLVNGNLKQFKPVNAANMPRSIILDFIEEGEEPGPYGAKSIGECAAVPGAPAVANAVADAIGRSVDRIPLTPERILDGSFSLKEQVDAEQ
jgi:CO/xanthine dehydrogenase Mo-binding subunit